MNQVQKNTYSLLLLFFVIAGLYSQEIPNSEYQQRREKLRKLLPDNSAAVFFSAPIKNRSNDTDYHYHPDRNLLYLTGWEEPHTVLVVFKNLQTDEKGVYSEVLYVRDRDPYEELWNGNVLGVKRAQRMKLDRVKDRKEFITDKINFEQFAEVLIYEFQNDVRNRPNDNFDLYSLQKDFKKQLNYPQEFNSVRYGLYQKIRNHKPEEVVKLKAEIKRMSRVDPGISEDQLIQSFLKLPEEASQKELKIGFELVLAQQNFNVDKLPVLMGQLREIKSPSEINLLRKAIGISVAGQIEVMKALHPQMSEREVQGIHEFVYKKYGAEDVGYPSIVGAGGNGCVLHYSHNELETINNQLVLMDVGAEYRGYTADITRTLPANGKFTEAQRELYQVVYDSQEAAIGVASVGASFFDIHKVAYREVAAGLKRLGLIEKDSEMRRYLPHGVSHHIGLDVHDPGEYELLKPNMVITIEPGIYVPEGSPCDPKWWNLGIRIEDDILISEQGPINLSAWAPRKWDEIEKMMTGKSILSDWELPTLDD